MKKALLRLASGAVVTVVSFWLMEPSANAMKPFRDAFVATYVKPDSTDAKDKAFAEAVQTAKCNICHEGKSKRERNVYGRALGKFLTENDAESPDKIKAALEKAAAVKYNPDDPKSQTFGDRIKAGILPGGDPAK